MEVLKISTTTTADDHVRLIQLKDTKIKGKAY